MLERFYIAIVATLDRIIWTVDVSPTVHKFFLAPDLGDFRVFLGKIRAVRVYRRTIRNVPAYKDFIERHPHQGPKIAKGFASLNDVPEMDKASYVKRYSLVEKVQHGTLPKTGVMFDESSGSSGKPTSWVRGKKERRMTRRIMQVAFRHFIGEKNPIILNTFSMGAWATGFNTSTCLLDIGRVKSIGPDITKVVDTLVELGPENNYLILGYPPFLRQLIDREEIDWNRYRIAAIFGGEGMSESMREYLEQYYTEVVGSYGASDLEINIAHESEFTIGLRKALLNDAKLRKLVLNESHGIIPMVFQYNPYDYLFETNEKGELLVTICRTYNLSPRIRYNIHDIGHSIDFYKLKSKLNKHGYGELLKNAELDFGVLFHYGRSDLSVDYNGAVVGPEEVRQVIESDSQFRDVVNTFRLISYEDEHAKKHLMIAIETVRGKTMDANESSRLLDTLISQLKLSNMDFKSALSTAEFAPEVRIFSNQEGIFDADHTKLKNDYIWNIDYKRAKEEGVVTGKAR
jgi:phenylacetate-CoA ligase